MLASSLHSLGSNKGLVIFCYGKKKGRDKVVKKSTKTSPAGQAIEKSNGVAEPPRIKDTSHFSLKSQLHILKTRKETSSIAPAPRSKFRRKRQTCSQAAASSKAAASEISDLAKEEDLLRQGRGITSLYNTNASTNPPAVLVDGYNLLMLWLNSPGEEKRKTQLRGSLEASRLEILRDLSDYSGWRKLRMMVAFDAQGNPDAAGIARNQEGGVEIVFVGSGEADSFIITEAQELRKSGCPYVLVASSDNDIRDACWTNEIFPMSAVQLLKEIRKAKKEADIAYKESLTKMRSDRVGVALMRSNPALFSKLEKARVRAWRK